MIYYNWGHLKSLVPISAPYVGGVERQLIISSMLTLSNYFGILAQDILIGWDGTGSTKQCSRYDGYFFYVFWELY